MSKQFAIREIRWEDFPVMVKNYFSYFEELREDPSFTLAMLYEKKPTWQNEVDWWASFYKSVLDKDTIAIVAISGGSIVGSCEVRRDKGVNHPHIGTLGVAIRKEYRSMGIGQALIKEALKRSKGRFEIVVLSAFAQNARAIHVYKKMGFKQYAKLDNALKRGRKYFDEIEMYVNLKKFG